MGDKMSARSTFEYMVKKWDEHVQRREGGIIRKYPEHFLSSHYKRWRKTCSRKQASKATGCRDITSALQYIPQHISSNVHYIPQPLRAPHMVAGNGSTSAPQQPGTTLYRPLLHTVTTLGCNSWKIIRPPPGDVGATEHSMHPQKRCRTCKVPGCPIPGTCPSRFQRKHCVTNYETEKYKKKRMSPTCMTCGRTGCPGAGRYDCPFKSSTI
jgi:hypothetical protein